MHYRAILYQSTRTSPLLFREKEKILINIDNILMEFITHKTYKRGYLHKYTYSRKINNYFVQLYLPVEHVLDGKIFHTRRKEERNKTINQRY